MYRVLPRSLSIQTATAFALRFLAQTSLAVWFGGFTFYSAVVVPDLHDHLGAAETGDISRRVAVFLYGIGALALLFSWIGIVTDRALSLGWQGKTRLGLLVTSTLLLIALNAMHRSLEARLEAGEILAKFRVFHEQYLMVWTGQWLAILGLMALNVSSRIFPEEKGMIASNLE